MILALDKRKVRLPTVNSTYDVVPDLHKVLFVPKLTKNLLSVPEMALMGAEIRFDQVSASDSTASPEVWHRRFGHLNYTYMNQLKKKKMVDGMNYDSGTQTQKDCEACVLGKMQK